MLNLRSIDTRTHKITCLNPNKRHSHKIKQLLADPIITPNAKLLVSTRIVYSVIRTLPHTNAPLKKHTSKFAFIIAWRMCGTAAANFCVFICSRLNENDLKNERNSCERLINCAYRFVSKQNVPAGQIAQL